MNKAALKVALAEVERLRSFAIRLISQSDNVRATHSRQLFDSVAQQLAAVQLELAAANERLAERGVPPGLTRPREIVGLVLEEVQELSNTLHPGALDRSGLPAALQKMARLLARQHGVEIEVIVGDACADLSPLAALILHESAEHALRDAVLHDADSPILVTLMFRAGHAELEVSDDRSTIGSDPSTGVERNTRHSHLRDMLELVGGTLLIRSGPHCGTTVAVAIPCSPVAIHDRKVAETKPA